MIRLVEGSEDNNTVRSFGIYFWFAPFFGSENGIFNNSLMRQLYSDRNN